MPLSQEEQQATAVISPPNSHLVSAEVSAGVSETGTTLRDYQRSAAFTEDLQKAFAQAAKQAQDENERLSISTPLKKRI